MPVSQAIVAYSMLDDVAAVTVIGDNLQMPPIHPIEPPAGKDHLVGSIYGFYRHYRRDERRPEAEVGPAINRIMLDRSRCSNAEIVAFVREAGYPSQIRARSRSVLQPDASRSRWTRRYLPISCSL